MSRHLVVEVKERDLQEYIDKLDSKGWAVMDIEPLLFTWNRSYRHYNCCTYGNESDSS